VRRVTVSAGGVIVTAGAVIVIVDVGVGVAKTVTVYWQMEAKMLVGN